MVSADHQRADTSLSAQLEDFKLANAGERLWRIQKTQRTGLCVGLDPHYTPDGAWDTQLYQSFAKDRKAQDLRSGFYDLCKAMNRLEIPWNDRTAEFLTGLTF